MIEIKETDIRECKMDSGHAPLRIEIIGGKGRGLEIRQLKHQILQDREDVKKYKIMEEEFGSDLFEYAKKWNILLNGKMEEFSDNDVKGLGELYIKAQKDRHIVKRLEEEKIDNEKYHSCKNVPEKPCTACVVKSILQKILEGKEEVRTDGDRELGMEY